MRHKFGGTLDAWTFDLGDAATSQTGVDGFLAVVAPGMAVTFWDSAAAGTQYAALLDQTSTEISTVTSDGAGELPEFWGPDADPDVWWMWADANGGAGPRRQILATDMGSSINELRSSILNLIADNDAQATLIDSSMGVVSYDAAASSWPARPADSRVYMWIGPTAPPVGGGYMQDGKDVWLNTVPAAG